MIFLATVTMALCAGIAPQPEISHDPAMEAIDKAWKPRFEALARQRRTLNASEVMTAIGAATERGSTPRQVYRAILLTDAHRIFGRENVRSNGLVARWKAFSKRGTFESGKADLLVDESGWGSRSLVPTARKLLATHAADPQLALKGSTVLMGYGTTEDIGLAYRVLTKLRNEYPRWRSARYLLAMCSVGQGNRNPREEAKYFAVARTEYKSFLSLGPSTGSSVTAAKIMLEQLETWFRTKERRQTIHVGGH